jgi:hypothetical protein
MDTQTIVLIIVAAIVVIAVLWFMTRRRHSDELKDRFGPEYQRTVREVGSRGRAESELEARRNRVSKFNIVPLAPAVREGFADRWRQTQARFVDDPSNAIHDADRLIGELMQARGYPVGNFEQQAADISVEHPDVVSHYREAHRIALRHEENQVSTEDLRKAMIHYRALFEDLLDTSDANDHHQEERHARAS